jgi:hypothetical protein
MVEVRGGLFEPTDAGRQVGCTTHCTGCGTCFSSLKAFDRHRSGGRCVDPERVRDGHGFSALVAKTDTGVCSLRGGDPFVGVTIWAVRADLEAAERFAA